MVLSTSSRFVELYIGILGTGSATIPSSINYETDETNNERSNVILSRGFGQRYLSTEDAARLAILQEIYASSDGFRDLAGGDLDLRVIGFGGPYHTELPEYLETIGSYNPLESGSFERWQNHGKRVQGALAHSSTFTEDSDTQHAVMSFKTQIKTEDYTPNSGNYQIPFSEIDFVPLNSTHFRFEFNIPETDEYTASNLHEITILKALHKWLEDHYVSGTGTGVVGSSVGSLNSYTQGRHYSVTISSGNTKTFTVTQAAYGLASSSYIFFFSMNFQLTSSSATYSTSVWEAYLTSHRQTLSAAGVASKSPLGSNAQPIGAQSLDFGNDRKFLLERGVPVLQIKDQGDDTSRKIIIGQDRVASYSDLASHSSGAKLMPAPHERVFSNTIHIGPGLSTDPLLRMQTPPIMAGLMYNHREVNIHNRDTNRIATIADWNGVSRITLNPGQKCTIAFSSHDDGGGEAFGVDIPRRIMLADISNLGALNTVNYYTGNSTQWARPCPTPTSLQFAHFDYDAFSIGTGTLVDATQISATNFVHTPQTIKILKKGEFHFRQRVQIEITAADGVWASATLYIVRVRGSTMSLLDPSTEFGISSSSAGRVFSWELLDEVEVNDLFGAFIYYPNTVSLSPSGIQITSSRIEATLKPDLIVEYSQ